jgi:hypothetical protein
MESIRSKFLSENPNQTPEEQSQNLADLDAFVGRQLSLLQDRFRRLAIEEQAQQYPCSHSRALSRGIFRAVERAGLAWAKHILKLEIDHIQSMLATAATIRDHLSANCHAVASISNLEAETNDFFGRDASYVKNKRRSLRFPAKIEFLKRHMPLPLTSSNHTARILHSVSLYDPELCYCPPNEFDLVLEQFLLTDPLLSPIMRSTAQIIAEGRSDALLDTLGELNKFVREKLQVPTGPAYSVLFIGVVRALFQLAYILNPAPMEGNATDNVAFLVHCGEFSQQTVRDLDLSEVITKHYISGLPLATMFQAKQIGMLMEMAFMTNPIDLLFHVNQILGKLAAFFASSEGFMSFDDTLTLLLALLSIDPPPNALAIAEFVQKWECIQLSASIASSGSYFVSAVRQIQVFHTQKESQATPTG